VHGGEDSLEALVRRRLAPTLAPSLSFRPGPLHRLDRGTSGIIVFSKTLAGAQAFSALLRRRLLVKRYLALLSGRLGRAETWDDPLARDRKSRVTHRAPADGQGREALSRVTPLETRGDVTLALIEIRTGRTHQIRAQAALHGHPLSGDRKYGGPPPAAGTEGFSLHAWELEFPASLVFSPDPGLPRKITAPPPARGAWAHYRRVTSN
jgi:23S rRNA pseudouridine955/2504/2580 synthase